MCVGSNCPAFNSHTQVTKISEYYDLASLGYRIDAGGYCYGKWCYLGVGSTTSTTRYIKANKSSIVHLRVGGKESGAFIYSNEVSIWGSN